VRATLFRFSLILVTLFSVACAPGGSSPASPAAGRSTASAPTIIAAAVGTPASTATRSPATEAPTPKPKVTPAATTAPNRPSTPDPNATWVPLVQIDHDLSHGLLRQTDLGSSWTVQGDVDLRLLINLTQVNCDGTVTSMPVAPTSNAEVEFTKGASTIPSPALIHVNWSVPDSAGADADFEFIKEMLRCSSWLFSAPNAPFSSASLHPYAMTSTVGDESAAIRLDISLGGAALELTTVYFRAGSVISALIYADIKPADQKTFHELAAKAAQRTTSLHL